MWYLGAQGGMAYFTRFLIEKSLSMDNVFVIALNFHVLCHSQTLPAPCAFFWGILGVIALRAIMIALGATLVSQFSWVRYIFGIFLVFTGIKMWVIADHVPDIGNYPILKLLKRHLRVTEGFRGNAKAQPNQRLSWACVTSSQVKNLYKSTTYVRVFTPTQWSLAACCSRRRSRG